jgi:hypothetical protein
MTIKAIETRYNGYRFRSRLEARWAVFFDALGIAYEYEKEGFDLGDGLWYLPDFWLSEYGYWFEVKGKKPEQRERYVAARLAVQTKGRAIIRWGECWYSREYNGEMFTYTDSPHNAIMLDECGDELLTIFTGIKLPHCDFSPDFNIRECPTCGGIDLTHTISDWAGRCKHSISSAQWDSSCSTPRLMEAYTAARQARFEFGEQGQLTAPSRVSARAAVAAQRAREWANEAEQNARKGKLLREWKEAAERFERMKKEFEAGEN